MGLHSTVPTSCLNLETYVKLGDTYESLKVAPSFMLGAWIIHYHPYKKVSMILAIVKRKELIGWPA